MSNGGDKNYSLRPRRAARGKYREMVSMVSHDDQDKDRENDESTSTMQISLLDETLNKRNVYLLPIVVSGENELLVENTIELEISGPDPLTMGDGTGPGEGVRDGGKTKNRTGAASKSSNALQKIEEILRNNDQLLESMNETSPSVRVKNDRKGLYSHQIYDRNNLLIKMTILFFLTGNGCISSSRSSSSENSLNLNNCSKSKTVTLTIESVKKMIHRPMTEEEEIEVNSLQCLTESSLQQSRHKCLNR